jgi:hypothetical protein
VLEAVLLVEWLVDVELVDLLLDVDWALLEVEATFVGDVAWKLPSRSG